MSVRRRTHFISLARLRCGPCKTIAPYIDQLSSQYPNAVFLKCDVEKCTVSIRSDDDRDRRLGFASVERSCEILHQSNAHVRLFPIRERSSSLARCD